MHDIERLSFKGGGVILAAGTSSERELLVAHGEASARRHAPLQFEVNGGRCELARLAIGDADGGILAPAAIRPRRSRAAGPNPIVGSEHE